MTNFEIAAALTDTVGRIPHLTGLYFRPLPSESETQESVMLHALYIVPDADKVYGEEGSQQEQEAVAIEDEQEMAFATRTGYVLAVIDVRKDVLDGMDARKGMVFEKVPLYSGVV